MTFVPRELHELQQDYKKKTLWGQQVSPSAWPPCEEAVGGSLEKWAGTHLQLKHLGMATAIL